MTAPAPFDGPFCAWLPAPDWPQALQRHVPGLVWLRKQASGEQCHTALPSDLFLLTVYCDAQLHCGPDGEGPGLEVVISPLRTAPAAFRSSGAGELVVALLTPLGLLQALRVPLEGVTDRRLPLACFCGWAEQRKLQQSLAGSGSAAQRLARLAAWLEGRIADSVPISGAAGRAAQAAMAIQHGHGEPCSIERIAASLATGRRQLERDFRRWLGTSPAAYARLVRFQRASAAVIGGRALAETAVDHGYADQAHMTRSFRELASCTPRELASWGRRADRLGLQRAFAGRTLVLHRATVAGLPAAARPPATAALLERAA